MGGGVLGCKWSVRYGELTVKHPVILLVIRVIGTHALEVNSRLAESNPVPAYSLDRDVIFSSARECFDDVL